MEHKLTRSEVAARVGETTASLPRQECKTCDCFQGFLTQLELDSRDDVSNLTAPWKVKRDEMHGCLGCDPCPPAAAFAEYLKEIQKTE
jgi:hypothetical protein